MSVAVAPCSVYVAPTSIVSMSFPTKVISGAVVSITSALFAPREFVVPGLTKVKVALFVAASLIVPEFNASELVST